MTFYLHTYLVVEKVLTPITFFFLLKRGKKPCNKGYTEEVSKDLPHAF